MGQHAYLSAQLSVGAPWITGHERVARITGCVRPVGAPAGAETLLCVLIVVAWRRQDRPALAVNVIVAGTVAATFISLARIVDVPYPYLVQWTCAVGALVALAIGWTFVPLLVGIRAPRPHGIAMKVVAIAPS